jgi:hypothetical protein
MKCLTESQNGFRNERSTIDSLLASRLLSSSARKRGVNFYKCFIDLTKAYDKVNREILLEVLKHRGVPSGMINLIKGMHEGA